MDFLHRVTYLTAALTCTCMGVASPALAQGTLETIARSGDPAPDGNGTFDFIFNPPSVNNAGEVVFVASFAGTSFGILDNQASVFYDGGPLQVIVREMQAPPEGNGEFLGMEEGALNAGGQTVFFSTLRNTNGGPTDDSGIYFNNKGIVSKVVREGESAPDLNGVFDAIFDPSINSNSNVAFYSSLSGTSGGATDNNGVYFFNGSLSRIARAGEAAPDGNGTFSIFGIPIINDNDNAAFRGVLTGTSGGATDNVGIYVGNTATLTKYIRLGEAAPDGNGVYATLNNPALNDNDEIAILGTLSGTSGGADDNIGIFKTAGGPVETVVRAGQASPDGNGEFSGFNSPAINNSGQVAVDGLLRNTVGGASDDRALMRGDGTDLDILVRKGQAVPEGNGVFDNFNTLAINSLGYVSFFADLSGTSGGVSDNSGIYLANGFDILNVAREGDLLNGNPITVLELADGQTRDGDERSGLNDSGQVAFNANDGFGFENVMLFSIPDYTWTDPGSGAWSNPAGWSQAIAPNSFHNVSIQPDNALTVSGPAGNSIVKSLTIGGGTGQAVLDMIGTIDGDLRVLETTTIASNGELRLNNGRTFVGTLLNNSGVISGNGVVQAELTVFQGGEVRVGAGDRLHLITEFGVSNLGRIEAIGSIADFAEIEFDGFTANAGGGVLGTIVARNAILRFNDGLTNGGVMMNSAGTADIYGDVNNVVNATIAVAGNSTSTFYDDVTNGGTLNVHAGSIAVFFGALSGNGNVGGGDVQALGDLLPGFSPGLMSFGGDLQFGPLTNLQSELAGLTPGSEFDQITVAGDLNLSGALSVSRLNNFALNPGMTFELIQYSGSLTGAFSNIINDTGLAGLILNVVTDADSVNLILDGLAGDLNLDGFVGIDDLNIVLGNWNQNVTAGVWGEGDPSGDGFIGIDDLNAVLGNWNAGTPPVVDQAQIPEPGVGLIALGGLISLVLRRS